LWQRVPVHELHIRLMCARDRQLPRDDRTRTLFTMDEARRLQLRRFAQMTPEERLRVGAGLSTIGMRWRSDREARRAASPTSPYRRNPAT